MSDIKSAGLDVSASPTDTTEVRPQTRNLKRKHHLCIMLTSSEMRILESRARARNLKKSAYVRDILFGASTTEVELRAREAQARAARLEEAGSDIRAALYELKRQGTNLNQIARTLNRNEHNEVLGADIKSTFDAIRRAATTITLLLNDPERNNHGFNLHQGSGMRPS